MKIVLPDNVGEGIAAYLQAMVAYRRVLRNGLAALGREHDEKSLLAYFSVDSVAALVDASSENFVDRARLSQLAKHLEGRAAARFLNGIYHQIENDPELTEFRSLLARTGNRAMAEDLPYFLEHRIRESRRELRQHLTAGIKQVQQAEPTEQNIAHA